MSANTAPVIEEQTRVFPWSRVIQAGLALLLLALLVTNVFAPIKPVAFAALVVMVVVFLAQLLDQFAPAHLTDRIATG